MRARFAVLALLAALPLSAQQKVERRIPANPDVSLRITNIAGSVKLVGWDVDSIVVIGSVPQGATFYFAGKGAGAKMGVERRDETLAEPGSTLDIRVPRGARISVRTGSANVEATGLRGELEVTSISGAVRAEGALKVLIAESMEGNLGAYGPMEVVRFKGGAGSITLRGARGDVLATTVGGAIIATDAALVRAHLETISGTIAYDGTVDPRGTLEVVTHSGDVTLRLPPEIAGDFMLESFDGGILPGLGLKGSDSPKLSRGKPLSFVTGGGGAHITVRSFKGDIRLLKQ